MPREPFVFKLYENLSDYMMSTPISELKKDETQSNYFIVENYRYIALISEHEVVLFPKKDNTRIQVKRYTDGNIKATTISNDFNSIIRDRSMDESIFDNYLKEPILKGIIEDRKVDATKL